MVLAELIAAAGLIDEGLGAGSGARDTGPAQLQGLKLVDGMARGHAVFHQPRGDRAQHRRGRSRPSASASYSAFRQMREQIDRMMSQSEFGTAGEHRDVLETYKMFAYDEGWNRGSTTRSVRASPPRPAIERVQQRTRQRMREIDDPLLRDRSTISRILANRLLRIVSGQLGTAAQMGLRQDSILIARNLGPAELLEYDRRRLKGVVLEEGSLTAHVTIVARGDGGARARPHPRRAAHRGGGRPAAARRDAAACRRAPVDPRWRRRSRRGSR